VPFLTNDEQSVREWSIKNGDTICER